MGARQRNIKSQYSGELASSSTRNIHKGGNELRSLARGIYEDKQPSYSADADERRMLELSGEVQELLRGLEVKKGDDDDDK